MRGVSSPKWLLVGLLIATLNPVFAGLIIGILYLSEKELRRHGWIVLGFSLIWKVIIEVFLQGLRF